MLEYVFCQAMIFIAFGLGLDPRQHTVLGPSFAPVLIGVSLALGMLCSSLVKPGYTGMCMSFSPFLVPLVVTNICNVAFNPARCLGLMTAKADMQYHYIHWLAPLTAAIVNGLFYHVAPPWQRETSLFSALTSRKRRRQ